MNLPSGPKPLRNVSLAVLAGGAGRRMKLPKAQLRIDGRPILERLMDRLDWPGPTILVTAPGRERPEGVGRFSREVTDPVEGEGPLQGVATALEAATTEELVLVPVDMPELTRAALEWLVEHFRGSPGASAVMVERMRDGERKLEPLPMACRVGVLRPIVRKLFGEGGRALRSLATEKAEIVACPAEWPLDIWTHLNRPEDLEAYGRSGRGGRTVSE